MALSTETLRGRLAVVTGAGRGIGLCFCHALAERGCNLVMISNQRDEIADNAALISEKYGVQARPFYCDLTSADASGSILSFMDSLGLETDILINNAGVFSFAPLMETSEARINCFVDLHVRAVTCLTRDFGRRMAERKHGYILNMSSMSCWMPMPGIALYAATKSYIRVLTRAFHYEMRDSGVKVMAACPGGIATDLFGLPPRLMKLAVKLGVIHTPEKFAGKALDKLLKGRMQYINGWLNRISIFFVAITPTPLRMMIKHRMLDKNIKRI